MWARCSTSYPMQPEERREAKPRLQLGLMPVALSALLTATVLSIGFLWHPWSHVFTTALGLRAGDGKQNGLSLAFPWDRGSTRESREDSHLYCGYGNSFPPCSCQRATWPMKSRNNTHSSPLRSSRGSGRNMGKQSTFSTDIINLAPQEKHRGDGPQNTSTCLEKDT